MRSGKRSDAISVTMMPLTRTIKMETLVVLRLIKVVVIVPAAVEGTNVVLDLGEVTFASRLYRIDVSLSNV